MYAPANQPPECHYNVTSSRQKLTVWVELCGNGDMLGPFFFDENVNRQSYINLFNKVIPSITLLFQILWKPISTFVVVPGWGAPTMGYWQFA